MISNLPKPSGWAPRDRAAAIRLEVIALAGMVLAALLTEPWLTLVGICGPVYLALMPLGRLRYRRIRLQRAAGELYRAAPAGPDLTPRTGVRRCRTALRAAVGPAVAVICTETSRSAARRAKSAMSRRTAGSWPARSSQWPRKPAASAGHDKRGEEGDHGHGDATFRAGREPHPSTDGGQPVDTLGRESAVEPFPLCTPLFSFVLTRQAIRCGCSRFSRR